MARFCEGLEEQGTRALRPEERARVAALRRSWTWTLAVRATLVPVAVLAAFPVLVALEALPPSTAREVARGIAVFVAWLAVLPMAALWAADAFATRRALGRDLREGAVRVFADPARSVEVLPWSRRVLARDGAPAPGEERVAIGEATPPPPDAPTYAIAIDDAAERTDGWVRRALTAAERDEVRRIAARLRRFPGRLLFITAVVASLIAKTPRGDAGLVDVALVTVGVFVTAGSWWRWARARTLSGRLLQDEADGWALRATAGDRGGMEILPIAGVLWTAGGVPSEWRVRAGGAAAKGAARG